MEFGRIFVRSAEQGSSIKGRVRARGPWNVVLD